MRHRGRLPLLASAFVSVLLVTGCTIGLHGRDKAGGSGEPVVLTIANTNGDLVTYTPAIAYFVHRVEEVSDGRIHIRVVNRYGAFADDAEQRVVHDTASGKADLGWVGARVFDTIGEPSMQALSAPMLIDSYALEDAVIHSSEVVPPMLSSLSDLGVVGLGVLADGLHKPMGVHRPIVGPEDWRGIRFGIFTSGIQATAVRALDATPLPVTAATRDADAAAGTIQGYEQGLLHTRSKAVYVTSNVTLWPQMDVLIANPNVWESLTDEQRGWLHHAADDAEAASTRLADTDQVSVRGQCEAGGRFIAASPRQLRELRHRFDPVYAQLEADPRTKTYIERIRRLKASTAPDPQLVIPDGCTGRTPTLSTGQPGTAPAYLNGVYRWTITRARADAAGARDDPDYPATTTFWLEDGTYRGSGDGTNHGTYWVKGDRITFHAAVYRTTETFTFRRNSHGDLTLRPVPPIDPGDAVLYATVPWTKIG
jgi:TRAP-type C4-dicarboxylate transport system substrate-binding protein